jgi:excinuclease UvrABC nuclease subunit
MEDVRQAIAFIEGNDQETERHLMQQINNLAADTRFEEAELLRRKLDKVRRARHEQKETFYSVCKFNYLVLMASGSVSRCKIAFVREGNITGFEEYAVESLNETLNAAIERYFSGAPKRESTETQYDEFCLVSNFVVHPLQSVDLFPVQDFSELPAKVMERIQQRRRKKKNTDVDTVTQ